MILTSVPDFAGTHDDTVMVGAVPVQLSDYLYNLVRLDGDPIEQDHLDKIHEHAMECAIRDRLNEFADEGAVAIAFRSPKCGETRRVFGIHYTVRKTADDDGHPISLADVFVGWK